MNGRERHVDWLARLLGLAGILVGGAACLYFYYQGEARQKELQAAVADAVDNSPSDSDGKAAADAFNARWDEQLTAALQDFKQRANEAIDREEKSWSAREERFRQQLAQIELPNEEPEVDIESLLQKKVEQLQSQLVAPQLRVAQSWKKPVGLDDARWTMIKNDGAREAQIQRITFTPSDSFEAEPVSAVQSLLPNANQLLVRFTPEHNKASEANRHAVYEREFEEPEIVPGDSYIQLRVEILNAAHLDWGLVGDLVIEYGEGRTLTVPGVQAVFVADSEDSA